MSDIGLKSIYLPFKIPFRNFSVFMIDIGTFQRAVKAFRVLFPFTIIHWSFTVHEGLYSGQGYTTAGSRVSSNWLDFYCLRMGVSVLCNQAAIVFYSTSICLYLRKKWYFSLLKKKKDSQVLILYLWFYFIEKRKTKIAQSFISAPYLF